MSKRILCWMAAFLLFIPSPARAANPMVKLGRGITNIAFSPFEYFTNLQKAGDRRGVASGAVEGILAGTYYTIGRILTGAYDVVTFPLPIPEGYGAVMKPDTVFGAATEA